MAMSEKMTKQNLKERFEVISNERVKMRAWADEISRAVMPMLDRIESDFERERVASMVESDVASVKGMLQQHRERREGKDRSP